jgi:hypothetical protein
MTICIFRNITMKIHKINNQILQFTSLLLVINKTATFQALIGDVTNIFIKKIIII